MLENDKKMTNFVVIHPHKEKEKIKQLYESLQLVDIDTNLIFVVDGLQEEDVNKFVEYVNENIEYSCLMNTCEEKEILENIGYMSGKAGDKLFVLKEGAVEQGEVKV